MPPSQWPVGKSVGMFLLFYILMNDWHVRAQATVGFNNLGFLVLRVRRMLDEPNYGEQSSKQLF